MFSLFLSIPLLLLVLAAPLASAQDLRAAAECVSASKRCTEAQSDASGLCKPTVYVTRQPDACIANACNYCYASDNWSEHSLCRSWGIRRWCYGGEAPSAPGRPAGLPSIAQRKRVGLAASSSPGRRRARKARASGRDRREGKPDGNGRRLKENGPKPSRKERKPDRNDLKPNRKGPKPNRNGRKPGGKRPKPSGAGAMLNESVMPIGEDLTLNEEKPTPDGKDLMPNEENPVANEEDPLPSAEASMPSAEGSMPSANGPISSASDPIPSAGGSMPNTEGSMPNTEGSMPNTEGSMPNTEGSMPNAGGSMPSAEGSMPNANNSMTNKMNGEPSEEGRQRRRWRRRPSKAALMPKEAKGGPGEKGRNPRQEGRKRRKEGCRSDEKAPVPNGVVGNSTMVQDKQGEVKGEKASRDGVVVLCMANVKPRSFWTQRDDGLIWRKDEPDVRDEPGQGEICKTFKVPSAGTYFVTAVTSAPRRSDNNDMFIKLMSGLRRYHARTHNFHSAGVDYFKGYQNEGRGVKSGDLFSVDNNPHVFVSAELMTERSHTLCISGRSSRFTVYKVLLVKCEAEGCRRNAMRVREAVDEAKKGSCTWDSVN